MANFRLSSAKMTTDKLDAVFDKALVLLTILAAAELAYVTATPSSTSANTDALKAFTLMETTLPFLFLIPVSIIRDLFINKTSQALHIFVSLFSWDLWGFTLFVFLTVLVTMIVRLLNYSINYAYAFVVPASIVTVLFILKIAGRYWEVSRLNLQKFGSIYKGEYRVINKKRYNLLCVSAFSLAGGIFLLITLWALSAFYF